jgi:16S rRNA processing protein RimM
MNGPGDELIIVARLVRTRGLKGELLADVLTDFPERFADVSEVTGVSPDGRRIELTLEQHWFQKDRVVLKFEGYDTVDAAASLVGLELGLPEQDRIQLPSNEFYDWELEGCSVENANGEPIGRVREVMRTGGVELLVIEGADHDEHLVPMAAEIVLSVDVPGKKIRIDPPEGLLDL